MEERRMEDKTRMIHKVYLNVASLRYYPEFGMVLSFDAEGSVFGDGTGRSADPRR